MPSGMAFFNGLPGSCRLATSSWRHRSFLFCASSLLQLAGPISILQTDHILTRHWNNI